MTGTTYRFYDREKARIRKENTLLENTQIFADFSERGC